MWFMYFYLLDTDKYYKKPNKLILKKMKQNNYYNSYDDIFYIKFFGKS